jgi:hypothetical protein
MDYFSATVLVTPVWIALGGLAVLFTRRLLWLYLSVCALLAVVSWLSGVAQLREQRSFEAREKAVQAGQQRLNAEFEQLAIALKIPPNSPPEMILKRMHAMDTPGTAASARLTSSAIPK